MASRSAGWLQHQAFVHSLGERCEAHGDHAQSAGAIGWVRFILPYDAGRCCEMASLLAAEELGTRCWGRAISWIKLFCLGLHRLVWWVSMQCDSSGILSCKGCTNAHQWAQVQQSLVMQNAVLHSCSETWLRAMELLSIAQRCQLRLSCTTFGPVQNSVPRSKSFRITGASILPKRLFQVYSDRIHISYNI